MFLVPSFFEFQTWDMVLFRNTSFLPGETTNTQPVHRAFVSAGEKWIKYIGCACMEWDIAPTVN